MNWIEWNWTEEKPFPEDKDTYVYVLMVGDSPDYIGHSAKVHMWYWEPEADITHYAIDMEKNVG